MNSIFEGIKVLDFTNNMAGPAAAAMLCDFGAEVIKVERPGLGDDTRGFDPYLGGESLSFCWPNRGKKSIEIDLNDPEGQEIIRQMIPHIDVIIESYRPGIMKKFGLDYEKVVALKSDIIYCSISAFGQTGPYAMKPGYDLLAQAMSGIMDLTGDPETPPVKSGIILGDFVGGLNGYGSIAAALYHHLRTGEGQFLDISLYEGLVSCNGALDRVNVGDIPTRMGNHNKALCPYGVFTGNHGQSMVICAPNNKLWTLLCQTMGKPEGITDPRFSTASARCSHLPDIIEFIEAYLKGFEDINEAFTILDGVNIPCCKVANTADVAKDKHLLERGTIIQLEGTAKMKCNGVDSFTTRGPWNKFSKTPAVMKAASFLGEHNHEILERYGIAPKKIDALETKWRQPVAKK